MFVETHLSRCNELRQQCRLLDGGLAGVHIQSAGWKLQFTPQYQGSEMTPHS